MIEKEKTPMIIIGGTGMGKAKLITSCHQQDEFGRFSKIVVDPSGMLARGCLAILEQKNAVDTENGKE